MVTSELFESVKTAFNDEGWAFSEIPDREVIQAGFEAHHTRVSLHVQVFEKLSAVSVVSESALVTDNPLKRDRLAELAMRTNQSLTVGNFEIDWDAGRFLFRATNIFPTPQGDLTIIKGLVHNTVGEMDRASPIETLIHQAEDHQLPGLNLIDLLKREDLLPEVPLSNTTS